MPKFCNNINTLLPGLSVWFWVYHAANLCLHVKLVSKGFLVTALMRSWRKTEGPESYEMEHQKKRSKNWLPNFPVNVSQKFELPPFKNFLLKSLAENYSKYVISDWVKDINKHFAQLSIWILPFYFSVNTISDIQMTKLKRWTLE